VDARPRKRQRARFLRRLRLAALAVALIAVVAFAIIGRRGVHQYQPVAVSTPPAAPLYSSAYLRGGAAWTQADARRVVQAASPIVNGAAFPATSSAVIIDAKTGHTLYEHNAHMPLVPASTIKLIVAGTALHDLGAGYRFQTTLATDGSVAGATLHGDAYLVGGGDPELSTADLRGAVHQIKSEGIAAIDGGIVADGTLYGPDAVNKTWDPDDLEYGWAAPPSAMTLNNGSVQFTILPDPNGGLASVETDPPSGAGRLIGHVRTVSEYGENTLHIDPLPDGSGYAFSGQIPYGAPQKYWRAIAHPTQVTARVMRELAIGSGVGVSGAASSGKAPSGATTTLWSHRSRPLASIVHRMAFDSDNHIAEQLLRAVGARSAGIGTLENGIDAEHAFLASLNADDSNMTIADGSGLSDQNHVTAASLGAVLRSMLAGPDARQIVALLPRVGIEGTVRFRTLAPDITGRVRGKDGYITGASGIAGYVETAHHGVVVYAFLANNWEQGLDVIWNGQDEILSRLARM
jgi:D-alanyl-D-alanine carboxypeptidase/D-alanyl-D-alanine-endopeptidase (penicillin-binding protein 4)